jgi:hypothetical protein
MTKIGAANGQSTTTGESAARLNCAPELRQNRNNFHEIRARLTRLELRRRDETRSRRHIGEYSYALTIRASALRESDQDFVDIIPIARGDDTRPLDALTNPVVGGHVTRG